MKTSIELYTINKKVKCVKCNNKGAIQIYGLYHPKGLGENASSYYQNYKDSPYMEGVMGPGGTIPHECINCGNQGLIDFGGLEGFEKAFDSIK
jgi:hypothetical protein